MRLFDITLFIGLACVLSACGPLSKLDVWRTVTNGRDGWQHPEAVIAALDASRESPAHDAPPNPNGGASDDGDDDRQTSFF